MTQIRLCCSNALLDRGPFLTVRGLDLAREKHGGKRETYAENRTSNHDLIIHYPTTCATANPCRRLGNARP